MLQTADLDAALSARCDARDAPDQALVERLASLLGGAEVVHLDPAGTPVAATASDLGWVDGALRAGVDEPARVRVRAGAGASSHRCTTATRRRGWLAVLLTSAAVTRQVARPVVRSAGELLGLVAATRLTVARGAERGVTASARGSAGVEGEPDDGLAGDAGRGGVDFTRPCRVADPRARATAPRGCGTRSRRRCGRSARTACSATDGDDTFVLAQHDLEPLATTLAARIRARRRPRRHQRGLERLAAPRRVRSGRAGADRRAVSAPVGPVVQRHDVLEPSVALLGATLRRTCASA